ncbi:RNA-binding protein 24-like isoform X1 [Pollicipes pollicipes]|uniref:RNA-binding protein 24-like isoform X1 n=2 Tax=Pollicipes pollicipes TaxID=41117 RepID=UPI001884FC7E|nr:RNA-binding protein 24-like isoform X1 [Pollicipes pollicipes]
MYALQPPQYMYQSPYVSQNPALLAGLSASALSPSAGQQMYDYQPYAASFQAAAAAAAAADPYSSQVAAANAFMPQYAGYPVPVSSALGAQQISLASSQYAAAAAAAAAAQEARMQ